MFYVVMLNIDCQNVVMLSVVMLNVIMPRVTEPTERFYLELTSIPLTIII
jgi:hypothetical protein